MKSSNISQCNKIIRFQHQAREKVPRWIPKGCPDHQWTISWSSHRSQLVSFIHPMSLPMLIILGVILFRSLFTMLSQHLKKVPLYIGMEFCRKLPSKFQISIVLLLGWFLHLCASFSTSQKGTALSSFFLSITGKQFEILTNYRWMDGVPGVQQW